MTPNIGVSSRFFECYGTRFPFEHRTTSREKAYEAAIAHGLKLLNSLKQKSGRRLTEREIADGMIHLDTQ